MDFYRYQNQQSDFKQKITISITIRSSSKNVANNCANSNNLGQINILPTFTHKRRVSFDYTIILLDAIREHNIEDMNMALAYLEVRCLNTINASGMSPLHLACLEQNIDAVSALLRKGVDCTLEDIDGWTALHISCSMNCPDIAEILLSYGADPHQINPDGESPIMLSKTAEMQSILLKKRRESLDDSDESDILVGLTRALANNTLEAFYSSLNISSNGTTLHLAAAHGYVKVARFVLENQLIDVNATDEDNWTPLHAAYNWSHQKIIKLLLIYKADNRILSKDYFAPQDLGKDK